MTTHDPFDPLYDHHSSLVQLNKRWAAARQAFLDLYGRQANHDLHQVYAYVAYNDLPPQNIDAAKARIFMIEEGLRAMGWRPPDSRRRRPKRRRCTARVLAYE